MGLRQIGWYAAFGELVIGVTPVVCKAQEGPVIAGVYGTALTPVIGLPPMATALMAGASRAMPTARLQYGHFGGPGRYNVDNLGLTLAWPMGAGLISATGGYAFAQCPRTVTCHGHSMIAVGWERRILALSLGVGRDAAMFGASVVTQLGRAALPDSNFLNDDPVNLYGAGLTMPLSLAVASGRVRAMPFFVPGFAIGRFLSERAEDTGVGITIGGGIGVTGLVRGLNASVSFTKYQSPGANGVIGLGLSWSKPE